jgi:hypothetical protein
MDDTPSAMDSQEQCPGLQMDDLDSAHMPAQEPTEHRSAQAGGAANNGAQSSSTCRDGPMVKPSKHSPSVKRGDMHRGTRIGEQESTSSKIRNFVFGTSSSQQQRYAYSGDGFRDLESHYENKMANLERQSRDMLEREQRKWKEKERNLLASLDQISLDKENAIRELASGLRKSEVEISRIQSEYDTLFREQQEEWFKRMESARWRPVEEGKVMNDLDRFKRDMRNWAKGSSVAELSLLESLDATESTALMQDLEQVVLFENGQLPVVLLNTKRSPMILLNALIAHNLYKSFFQNPFFFRNSTGDDLTIDGREDQLQIIYREAKLSKVATT